MKQVLIKKGISHLLDVPVPSLGKEEVLVQVCTSCLSIGTELASVKGSAVPMWKRALAQPEKIKTALSLAVDKGLSHAIQVVSEKKEAEYPTGYSAAGVVVAVGKEIYDLKVGDRLACAGGQYAYHAEFIRVPRNLCVPIPAGVGFDEASTITLGAIALQGVRRAMPTLGETFVVVGLGILGQLTVQILRANGCRAIGIDMDEKRVKKALTLGMEHGYVPSKTDEETVLRMTDGYGADGVVITAATASDEVVSNAFKICRKKGRVVLVGDVGLNLQREDFYAKEIDFFISTSYGPGRYDQRYEEKGLDYPIGYVRWTENRNMAEYIRLIAAKQVEIEALITDRYPIEEVSSAYSALEGTERPLLTLLKYPSAESDAFASEKRINLKVTRPSKDDKIRVALIGAGGFAKSAHLPNMKKLSNDYKLHAVVNRTGPSAKSVGQNFGAEYVSTDPQEVLADSDIDAVIIATRHNLHGSLVMDALEAGKHVLVEKPLTIDKGELERIETFFDADTSSKPLLLTGYNRRFSPYARRIGKLLSKSHSPFMLTYRMNAGFIPQDHWVHGPEGGGRNLGEACHIYDLFTAFSNSKVSGISAHAIRPSTSHYRHNDNFIATLSFSNGSVANLVYTALGNKEVPKETAELYLDGKIAILNDYKSLDVFGESGHSMQTKSQDKGLLSELECFANGIRTGEWPIPLWQQLQVSHVAFAIEEMLLE